MTDPYEILNISSTATDDEVKRPIGSWPGSTTRTTTTTIPWRIWPRRR